jgi:hypothetical protein
MTKFDRVDLGGAGQRGIGALPDAGDRGCWAQYAGVYRGIRPLRIPRWLAWASRTLRRWCTWRRPCKTARGIRQGRYAFAGKDTTGHWEWRAFGWTRRFHPSAGFPAEVMEPFEAADWKQDDWE